MRPGDTLGTCAPYCIDSCPAGYTCDPVGNAGTDPVYLCTPPA